MGVLEIRRIRGWRRTIRRAISISRGDFEQEILSLIFEEQRNDSLYANLSRASRAAATVRDRLSSDLLRVVSQLGADWRALRKSSAWGYVSPGDALAVLNRCIGTLSSLRGIELENITRGPGWHFLGVGQAHRALDTAGESVSRDHRPVDRGDLADARDAARSLRQRDDLPVALFHGTAGGAGAGSADERRDESAVAGVSDQGSFRALRISGENAGRRRNGPWRKQRRVEEAAASLFGADVEELCQPRTRRDALAILDHLLRPWMPRCRRYRMPSPTPGSAMRRWSGPT